jgi:hypothetical protein
MATRCMRGESIVITTRLHFALVLLSIVLFSLLSMELVPGPI